MTRCSLMGGYQRIGELTMSIFSNLKYSSTTTQHTTAWNLSIYFLPNFLPWSTFLLHIYSKPLNLHYLLFFPCIFLWVAHSRCSLDLLIIHSFFKHAYTPLFRSKVFISMFSAVTVKVAHHQCVIKFKRMLKHSFVFLAAREHDSFNSQH